MRGHGEETDSNCLQLLSLRGFDDKHIKQWLMKKTDKYTSAEIQNEMLKLMSLNILRKIAANIQQVPFFTIMADETTDKSNC